jgi:hypothetical protein
MKRRPVYPGSAGVQGADDMVMTETKDNGKATKLVRFKPEQADGNGNGSANGRRKRIIPRPTSERDEDDPTKPIIVFQAFGSTSEEDARIKEICRQHPFVRGPDGKWTDNGGTEALEAVLKPIHRRYERKTGFYWSKVPDEATEEEWEMLDYAWRVHRDREEFAWILEEIQLRIKEDERIERVEADRRKRKEARDRYTRPYFPLPRTLPPTPKVPSTSGNPSKDSRLSRIECAGLVLLAVIAWHGHSGKGCWEKRLSFTKETALTREEVKRGLEWLYRNKLVETRGEHNTGVAGIPIRFLTFPFKLKGKDQTPHLRLEQWIACAFELNLTTKLVWAACDELAWRQDDRHGFTFSATAHQIASVLPIPMSKMTVCRALNQLQQHGLLLGLPDGVWQMVRNHDWYWEWFELGGGRLLSRPMRAQMYQSHEYSTYRSNQDWSNHPEWRAT